MVTLGFWGFDFVGSEPVQASTTAHELGHNLNLWHGGFPGNPNCSPAYLSVMNYLFQAKLLRDNSGGLHVDFSGAPPPPLNEFLLSDGPLGSSSPYRTGWYAPKANVAFGSAATKYCNGSEFPNPLPVGQDSMVRVDSQTASSDIDWNRNGSAAGGIGVGKVHRLKACATGKCTGYRLCFGHLHRLKPVPCQAGFSWPLRRSKICCEDSAA